MPMFGLETDAAKLAFLLQRAGLLAKTAQRFNQGLVWAEALRTCVPKTWGVEIFVHDLRRKASPQIDPGQPGFRDLILAGQSDPLLKKSVLHFLYALLDR